jgi:S1-C subfamily serine protease
MGRLALIAKVCLLGSMLLVSAERLYSQCVTCHDFSGGCNGYSGSQTDCGAKHDCLCGIVARPAFADALHPGLLTQQEGTALVVTDVFAGGPASASGILPGDRIVLLNGKVPTLQACSPNQWSSPNDPRSAVFRIVRGSARIRVTLRLVPVGQMLAKGWLSRSGQVKLAALGLDAEKEYGGFDRSYLLGFKWQRSGDDLEVSDVLAGSPAQRLGLAIGDRIETVNGVAAAVDDAGLMSLLPSDAPVTVRLTMFKSDGSRRNIELTSAGISSIFSKMVATGALTPYEQVTESF